MALTNKIAEFKEHFKIEYEFENVDFKIDDKNNFVAVFKGQNYILSNQPNKNKILAYQTMKYKKNYGSEFLRAIRLEESLEAKANRNRENKFQNYLKKQVMIRRFKHVNFVDKHFDIDSKTYVDQDKLIINESYIPTFFPVVLCYNSNPVKITLDYGQELIIILRINTDSSLCSRREKPLDKILDELEEDYERRL